MDVSEAKRLKALEAENAELKKIVAGRALDIRMLKGVNIRKWRALAERRRDKSGTGAHHSAKGRPSGRQKTPQKQGVRLDEVMGQLGAPYWPRLELRLRLRPVRRRSAAQMPDRGR